MSTITGLIKTSDVALFFLFNKKMQCRILNIVMRGATQLGTTLFSVVLSVFFLLSGNKQTHHAGLKLVLTLIASQVLVQSIKRIVNRPRPYKTLENATAVNPPACRYSFPSGHTCAAFSIAFVLAGSIAGLGILFFSAAVIVGFSRIYLGFHYPTDVLVGFLIAYATFVFINSQYIPSL